MGPWFEPGPGSHFSLLFPVISSAYGDFRHGNHRLIVFRSMEIGGFWAPIGGLTIHRSEVRVLRRPTTLSVIFQWLASEFRHEDPWTHWSLGRLGVALGAAQNGGGGGGGEENLKKRTLRFLHWGSVVDPKETPRFEASRVTS